MIGGREKGAAVFDEGVVEGVDYEGEEGGEVWGGEEGAWGVEFEVDGGNVIAGAWWCGLSCWSAG